MTGNCQQDCAASEFPIYCLFFVTDMKLDLHHMPRNIAHVVYEKLRSKFELSLFE